MSDRDFAFFALGDMAHDAKTSLPCQKLPLFNLSLPAKSASILFQDFCYCSFSFFTKCQVHDHDNK